MNTLKFDTNDGRVSVPYRDLLLLRQLQQNGEVAKKTKQYLDCIHQPTPVQLHTIKLLVAMRTDLGSDYEAALSLGCQLRISEDGTCITQFGEIPIVFAPGKGWRASDRGMAFPTIEEAVNDGVISLPD